MIYDPWSYGGYSNRPPLSPQGERCHRYKSIKYSPQYPSMDESSRDISFSSPARTDHNAVRYIIGNAYLIAR